MIEKYFVSDDPAKIFFEMRNVASSTTEDALSSDDTTVDFRLEDLKHQYPPASAFEELVRRLMVEPNQLITDYNVIMLVGEGRYSDYQKTEPTGETDEILFGLRNTVETDILQNFERVLNDHLSLKSSPILIVAQESLKGELQQICAEYES